jgi:hypothetical protein
MERRVERLESVATPVDQAVRMATSAIRQVLLNQLKEECEATEEYAFVVRAYLEAILPRST